MSRVERLSVAALLLCGLFGAATASAAEHLRELVQSGNYAAMKASGPGVLGDLARLYESADDESLRARVANTFYQLGWKSEDARRVLMRDVHSGNQDLRISVQYALGRVSDDPSVVDTLLANMQDDGNPLFRDKAACALAYDQIHLSEAQKVRLFAGLIHALSDSKPQVRAIAIQALQIHTGQTKGFAPEAPDAAREAAIAEWSAWLARYEQNLR